MKIIDLLQTRYTDYENQVKLYLSKTLKEYNENYGNNTVMGQLVNVLGSTVQNILLYIEDSLTEQNKYTASRLIHSIISFLFFAVLYAAVATV